MESSQIAGGALIVNHYNGQLLKALKSVYPHTSFNYWEFDHVPRTVWNNLEFQRSFLEWFAYQRSIMFMEEWYNVRKYEITQHGGSGLIEHYEGCFSNALLEIYPCYSWEIFQFEEQPPGSLALPNH